MDVDKLEHELFDDINQVEKLYDLVPDISLTENGIDNISLIMDIEEAGKAQLHVTFDDGTVKKIKKIDSIIECINTLQ